MLHSLGRWRGEETKGKGLAIVTLYRAYVDYDDRNLIGGRAEGDWMGAVDRVCIDITVHPGALHFLIRKY